MSHVRTFALAFVVATVSMAGSAALSPKLADWANGPVQWLMTRDDQRAWRDVKTDDAAQAFIDLFWARRDPTPGTPLNEFRNEFDARVAFADKNYKTATKRGALSDRGRVFIVLGPPKGASLEFGRTMDATGDIAGLTDSDTHREVGGKIDFEYERPFALGLTGPVHFVENLRTREFLIDTQTGNVSGALTTAVNRAIVNPSLTTVPEWAKSGPMMVRGPEHPAETETVVTTTTVTKRTTVQPAAPVAVARASGAHDLMLLENPRVIKVGEDSPFDGIIRKETFKKSDDVAFAFQYCTTSLRDPKPTLTMSITMNTTIGGQPVSVSTPEDEVTAETLRILPGCYLVRGAIPLDSLEPGSYQFMVNLKDAATGKTYNLQRDFKLE